MLDTIHTGYFSDMLAVAAFHTFPLQRMLLAAICPRVSKPVHKMPPLLDSKLRFSPYLTLFFLCLLSHGFLLLNNGSYNDGLLFAYYQQTDFELLRTQVNEAGRPLYYYYHNALTVFPDFVFAHKAAALIGIFIVAFSSFTLLKNRTPFSPQEALTITLISSLWPFYTILTSIVILPHIISLALFYTGWLIYTQKHRWYWRVLALVMIVLSFFHDELLIYHYAITFLFFLIEYRPGNRGVFVRSALTFVTKNLSLCLIPILFFVAKHLFFSPYGIAKGYNAIVFADGAPFLKTLGYCLDHFFRSIVREMQPLEGAVLYLLLFLPVTIPLAWYFYTRPVRHETAASRRMTIVTGFFLLAASVLGYVLAAKTPHLISYSARHGLVASLGAAMLVYGLFNLNNRRIVAGLLMAGLVFTDIGFYLSWQARWAQEESFVQHLKQIPPPKDISLFILHSNLNAGVDPIYHTSDATIFVARAWGEEKWAVVPDFMLRNMGEREAAMLFIKNNAANPDLARRVALSQFDTEGCWAELTLSPVGKPYRKILGFPGPDEMLTGIEYTYDRFFRPQNMRDLLDHLLEVTITPLHINAKGAPC